MGLAKSQEYSALVRKRDSGTWRQVGEQQGLAIYQQAASSHKCMAFPIDLCDVDSDEKLQLLNFRKLNRAHLVSIDCILLAETDLFCSQPKTSLLLVEYVPQRLSGLSQQLSLSEGLTVASAALAGYAILSFIFGPLYASEEMVCFDDKGKPKVWISYNLAAFQPSLYAINGRHESSASLIAELDGFGNILTSVEKEKKCVKQLLEVIEKATISGFPPDLKAQLDTIRTFRQGEEYIADYCRRNGFELEQIVSLERRKKGNGIYAAPHSDRLPAKYNEHRVSQLEQRREFGKLGRDFQLIEPERIEQIAVSRQATLPSQSHVQRSGLRSSLNSHSRINIIYNVTPQLPQPLPHQPPFNSTTLQPQRITILPINQPQQLQPIHIQQTTHTHTRHTQQMYGPKPIQVPPLLPQSSSQINRQLSIEDNIPRQSLGNQNKTVSLQHIQHHVVNSVESQEDLPPSVSNDEESQSEGNQFQLIVHEASDNEESEHIQNTSQLYEFDHNQVEKRSNDDIQMEMAESKEMESEHPIESVYSPKAIDELRQWEESLLRLTDKQAKQDWNYQQHSKNESEEEACLSEERDKVFLGQTAIEQFKNQEELEKYIRSKYSEYFSSEGSGEVGKSNQDKYKNIEESASYDTVRGNSQRQVQASQQRNSFKIPKGKSVSFSSEVEQKQERDRSENSQKYISNLQQTSKQAKSSSFTANRNVFSVQKAKTPANLINGIDERYNKYVMNKQPLVRKDLSYISNRSNDRARVDRQDSKSYKYFQSSSQREKPSWKQTPSKAELSYDQLRRLLKE